MDVEEEEGEITTICEVRKAVDAVTALILAVENDLTDLGNNYDKLSQVHRQWGAFLEPAESAP